MAQMNIKAEDFIKSVPKDAREKALSLVKQIKSSKQTKEDIANIFRELKEAAKNEEASFDVDVIEATYDVYLAMLKEGHSRFVSWFIAYVYGTARATDLIFGKNIHKKDLIAAIENRKNCSLLMVVVDLLRYNFKILIGAALIKVASMAPYAAGRVPEIVAASGVAWIIIVYVSASVMFYVLLFKLGTSNPKTYKPAVESTTIREWSFSDILNRAPLKARQMAGNDVHQIYRTRPSKDAMKQQIQDVSSRFDLNIDQADFITVTDAAWDMYTALRQSDHGHIISWMAGLCFAHSKIAQAVTGQQLLADIVRKEIQEAINKNSAVVMFQFLAKSFMMLGAATLGLGAALKFAPPPGRAAAMAMYGVYIVCLLGISLKYAIRTNKDTQDNLETNPPTYQGAQA